MIVEFKLDRTQDGFLMKPNWVKIMGGLEDLDNHTVIGFVDSDTVHKIPETVRVITTTQELKDRCQDIHLRYPYTNYDESTMTTGEVDTMVDDLVGARNIGGAGTPVLIRAGQALINDTHSPYALRYSTRTLKIDASAGSVTIDIPTAVGCAGLRFTFINTTNSAGNTVTLDPNASEKINGATTNTTALDAQYDTITIESDGANWLIV